MAIRRLTPEAVEAAVGHPKRQQVFIWDSTTTGLGLRVTQKGRKSFVYQYSIDGRDRRLTIGRYPEVDLETARAEVAKLRGRVDRREDPAVEQALEATTERSLGALWEKYERDHLARRSEGHRRNVRSTFERSVLPHFGKDTPVSEVTWEAVDAWHRQETEASGPVAANRHLAHLRTAFTYARRWGWLDRNLANPASDHETNREESPGKPFTKAQLKAIGAAVKAEENQVIQTALKVFLVSGLRPREVCHLRWADIGDDGIVEIQGKTGKRAAVLSKLAETWIREQPEVGPYVFPGREDDQPLGGEAIAHGLGNAWKRVQSRIEDSKPRLYNARHTWISTAAGLGITDDVRRVLSGHTGANGGGAHHVYLHAVPELRKAADRVAKKIANGLGL